jgi:predicted MFS family arabinose efflux permease
MGFGILLGGVVSEYMGYSATFWMVAIDNAVGVALFFFATRRFFELRRRKEI